MFAELFDGVVISGRRGHAQALTAYVRAGRRARRGGRRQCVYVDDLPFNLTPAEDLGMATVHHTSAETTIPELERLLGVSLVA